MYCNLLRDNLKIQINKKALSKKLIDLMSSDFKDTDKVSNNVFEGIEPVSYTHLYPRCCSAGWRNGRSSSSI